MKKGLGSGKLTDALRQRPGVEICSAFQIEIRERAEVSVMGCVGISAYSTESVVLRLKRGGVRICGSKLLCDSYTNGAVIISGKLDSVSFLEGEQ